MENGWYYARIDQKVGPFSPRQLKDLADAGTILRTDTVWKAGVAQGVRADRVKNLFAVVIVAPPPPPVEAVPEPDEVEVPRLLPLVPAEKAPEAEAPAPPPKPPAAALPKQPLKGRAIALSGALIVSQDGTRAKYRMVCKTCGHQDSACQSLMITNKTFKRNFYCPKCRKRRDVSIQCQLR